METVADFILGGSKITTDGDCSYEIKRCLPLRRKAITNLDSILKSRDISWPTKVCIVKAVAFPTNICIVTAIVFPVVIYRYESWAIKKVESQRIGAFELWCWRSLLRIPCTGRRSNQSILKEINPECSWEGLRLKLKLQYFSHLMRGADSLEKTWCQERWRTREKEATEGEVGEWHLWFNGHALWQTPGEGEGQGSLASCSPWGCKSRIQLGDWTLSLFPSVPA